MSRHKQMGRILRIAALIHANPRRYTRRRLAERCGVSLRTIQRDIEELRAAGIHIDARPSGYEIISEYFLPPVNFTLEEALALVISAKSFAANEGRHVSSTLEDATAKVNAALPEYTARLLRETAKQVDVAGQKVSDVDETIDRLYEAIRNCYRIHITYYSFSRDKTTERYVDPYAVMFRKRAWYLVGFCHTFRRVLTFRINRILRLSYTDEKFDYPEDFSLKEYMSKSWEVMLGEETDVVVKFDRRVAPLIKEVDWHDTQQIEELEDGSILFRVIVAGTKEIGFWIMSYGDSAEVIKPKSLRDEIIATARRMLKKYQVD